MLLFCYKLANYSPFFEELPINVMTFAFYFCRDAFLFKTLCKIPKVFKLKYNYIMSPIPFLTQPIPCSPLLPSQTPRPLRIIFHIYPVYKSVLTCSVHLVFLVCIQSRDARRVPDNQLRGSPCGRLSQHSFLIQHSP